MMATQKVRAPSMMKILPFHKQMDERSKERESEGNAPLPSRDPVFARETADDARADQPAKGARQADTPDVKCVTTTNLRARVYEVHGQG
jgi:hypothetical protein